MDWPRITVQIATYNRPVEIRRTIHALHVNLIYPNLHYLICDDSTGGSYLDDIYREFSPLLNIACVTTKQNSGWGANVNNGLLQIADNYIFFCEDDWLLHRVIDLRLAVAVMLAKKEVGFFRYDGITGHRVTANMCEANIRDTMPNYLQSWHSVSGKVAYWQLKPDSDELWLYSNRPHFKRKSFHDYYGLYPVGLKLGATEESFAHVVKDKLSQPDAPQIAVFTDYVKGFFEDIGISYQHTKIDK